MIQTIKQPWTELERQAWQLPPRTLVSDWADRNRIIAGYAAEPGPWRTDRTPYLKDIMDAYADPDVEEITITGPAQCGKSEAVFNMIGYTVDVDPAPTMYVIARDEDCEDISSERLLPMFKESPALRRHFTGKPWDLKVGRVFVFDRMPVYFTGSRSAAGLASKPIGRLFCDETDKYKEYVGKEGSPIKLAKRRTTTFPDIKIIYLCTLTTREGFIYQSYQLSNMQQIYTPCPFCGNFQVLKFGQLRSDPPDLHDPEIIIEKECVYYECEFCRGHITEDHKPRMVELSKWLPEGQSLKPDGTIVGKAKRSRRHVGFWINCMVSPWQPWFRLKAEFYQVEKAVDITPAVFREFKNQALAQVWEERGRRVQVKELQAKVGGFARGTVPDDCLMLVAGADYHEDERGMVRIDYEVRGFGYGLRNWIITSGAAANFDELEQEVLLSPFPWADPTGPNKGKPELAVIQFFIDSGFKPDEVYTFALRHPGLVIPTKGAATAQRTPLVAGKLDRVSPGREKLYRGMQLIIVSTEFFKDQVTTWAQNQPGTPGASEFYNEIPTRYFKDFCNEHKVKTRDKHGYLYWHWEPVTLGAQTHHLDTAVLTAAAAYYRKAHIFLGRVPGQEIKQPAAYRQPAAKKQTRKRPGHPGFLDNLPEL